MEILRQTLTGIMGAAMLALSPAAEAALPAVTMATGTNHFITADGRPFIPQGVNWVVVSPGTPATQKNISFNPDYYPAHRAVIHDSLKEIARNGFNRVRKNGALRPLSP
ncbi:hypothetical protein UCD39_00750 [Nitrospirillum sp. BR 11752]|uniref:hypothetical protein n=1 Tax=Nitrospirillum sp. BR 11752 TaxID=3104293 RepID=UPI002EB18702|nr:hypothetical protein [Nitrospirillum sp. BR 11752]